MNSWKEDITKSLKNLNGIGTLNEIYDEIKRVRLTPLTKNYQATIRRTLEIHSSDSQAFLNKDDLFYSVKGIGTGIWGLRYIYRTPLWQLIWTSMKLLYLQVIFPPKRY